MVRIRLQRRGRRKRPIHHVVVADSREARDGRIIEDLGRFNNLTAKNEVDLDEERAIYWLKQGAQPSDTVRSILRHQGILYKMHLIRWDKSEEEIEEALAEWRENREKKQDKKVATAKQKEKSMLEAEEKEYQKQLKRKAEEAAKERAKQEALEEAKAKEEKEKQAKAEEEQAKAAEESEETSDSEKQEPKTEEKKAKETSKKEEDQQEKVEEPEEDSDKAEETAKAAEAEKAEESSDQESKDDQQEAADAEEAEEEAASEEEADETDEEQEQLSTDLLAKEAINHIEETPLEELKGFVPDDESRVTVQRAMEEKEED